MKKHKVTMLLTAVLYCTALFAQQPVLALENVPQEVQSVFREKFPSAENIIWSLGADGNFEAKFMTVNEKERTEFDAHGKWIETGNIIRVTDIPKNVQDVVSKTYPGSKITGAERIQTNLGDVYGITLTVGNNSQHIRVTETGKIDKKITKK